MYLGQKVDADGRLVGVVKRVVHEPCDQGGFPNYRPPTLAITRGTGYSARSGEPYRSALPRTPTCDRSVSIFQKQDRMEM